MMVGVSVMVSFGVDMFNSLVNLFLYLGGGFVIVLVLEVFVYVFVLCGKLVFGFDFMMIDGCEVVVWEEIVL